MKLKLEDLAGFFGVELEEEFTVSNLPGTFRFERDRGSLVRTLDGEEAVVNILCLLNRDIIKKPWQPKENELFFMPTLFAGDDYDAMRWMDTPSFQKLLSDGLVFKTKEEATAKSKEIEKFLLGSVN